MQILMSEFKDRDVICAKNGNKIGAVCDIEFDSCSGKINYIFTCEKCKPLLFGAKYEPIKIKWEDIDIIGEDSILICNDCKKNQAKKKPLFDGLFR